jgi:predicted nucleic acid-binding Zn ribbon protein
VTTYQYRCAEHGPADVELPFGSAGPTLPCATCGAAMTRRFSPPMLGLAPRGIVSAMDRTRASAESPAVVTALPDGGRRAPSAPANPAWKRLPRP